MQQILNKKIPQISFIVMVVIYLLAGQKSFANPTVVLLSIDGFAQQYIEKYQPQNLLKLMKQGTYAKALLPVYPSKTFPNHLSIVTGSYTAKHGIIHNTFYRRDKNQQYTKGAGTKDGSWLKAIPIWSLAEKNGLTSAVYFWPESEVDYQGLLPTYNFSYNRVTSNETRFKQVISWLQLPENKRPKFIASYFSLVDHAGHLFGPDSNVTKKAVLKADRLIGEFITTLHEKVKQPINLIIVSDHGMQSIDKKSLIDWKPWLNNNQKMKIINGETQLLIYSNDKKQLKSVYTKITENADVRFNIYRQQDFPQHWHWSTNFNVLPDLVLNAKPPFVFDQYHTNQSKGTHGYDPLNNKNMEAIFIATGPSFKKNVEVPAFENIHIFPLLKNLLGITENTNNIDGNINVLKPYLVITDKNNHIKQQ